MACQITIIPDPPVAGQSSTVGYSGALPRTLTVEFTPGDSTNVTVPAEGVGSLDIPEDATDIEISDPGGPCVSLVRAVSGGG